MFDLKVSDSLIAWATKIVEKEMEQKFRGHHDGNKKQRITGKIGETVCNIGMGVIRHWTPGFDGGFDGVYDGILYDVKTITRTCHPGPSYDNNVRARQLTDQYQAQVYVFNSYDESRRILTVCGALTKELVLEKGKFIPAGTLRARGKITPMPADDDYYNVLCRDLVQVYSFDDVTRYFSTVKEILLAEAA